MNPIYTSRTSRIGGSVFLSRNPSAPCLRRIKRLKPDRSGQADGWGLDTGLRRYDAFFNVVPNSSSAVGITSGYENDKAFMAMMTKIVP